MIKPMLLALPVGLALLGLAPAADWPQWRGPDRTGISQDNGLIDRWPKDGPQLLWTFKDAGIGYSGMAVVGDRLYTMGADDEKEYMYALDLKSRKKLWSTSLGNRFKCPPGGDGPRGTPTVDGEMVYGIGGQGHLLCVMGATGEKIWSKRLVEDLGGELMSRCGFSESPLVDGHLVMATPGGKKGTVAAFDKKTGELKWRSKDLTDPAAHSSLIVADFGGIRQYVLMTGKSVAGVAAKDGSLEWRFERNGPVAAIPTPISEGNHVYATSGYGAGCTLIEITPGEKFKASKVYANQDMVNHHGGVVLIGASSLFGYSNTKGWICQDFKKGDVLWSSKNLGKGSLLYSNGHLVLFSEDNGTCVLIESSAKEWIEKGRFTIPERSKLRSNNVKALTHPTIANGRLYLPDQENIFCYDISKAKE